jgi:hypothetical protein
VTTSLAKKYPSLRCTIDCSETEVDISEEDRASPSGDNDLLVSPASGETSDSDYGHLPAPPPSPVDSESASSEDSEVAPMASGIGIGSMDGSAGRRYFSMVLPYA